MNRPLVAMLLSVAALAILSPAASGVTIHRHLVIDREPAPPETVVRLVDVAPRDSDDDGFANSRDRCPHQHSTVDHGCVPTPSPATSVSEGVAGSTPASTSVASAPGGTLGAIRECESGGSYTAVNPSGAGGAYQMMPSTWTGLGYSGLPQDAPPAEQDAAAAKLYAEQGTSPWVASQGCWG